MMTKSKFLVAEAVDDLDCTPEERSDVFEHLRDTDVVGINNRHHAREIAESYLQGIRDANAKDNAEPEWTRAHHTSQLCKASCCMAPATWQIWVEVVPGIRFSVYGCDKHAGKKSQCQ